MSTTGRGREIHLELERRRAALIAQGVDVEEAARRAIGDVEGTTIDPERERRRLIARIGRMREQLAFQSIKPSTRRSL